MADSLEHPGVSSNKDYELPVDSCDHMISTSLRDLRKKYSDLGANKSTGADINVKKDTKPAWETKSDLK